MIDTGAGISVAAPTFVCRIGGCVTPWTGPTVRLADGSPVEPEGVTTLTITDGDQAVEGDFLVMDLNRTVELLLVNNVL